MKIFVRKLNICPMRNVNVHQYFQALIDGGHEIVKDIDLADKVLVWTCAFRTDYHDNSIKVLKQYEKDGRTVVAAGCLPSINPELMSKEFNGEIIHFKNDKTEFEKVFGVDIDASPYPICERPLSEPIEEFRLKHPEIKVGWDDQYIKLFISEGCTKECSYCTERRAFGPYQSYPINKIIEKATQMVKRTGVYKLALFGDDIGAWGREINSKLPNLIRELINIDPKVQISLKQINPFYMKMYFDELIELVNTGKIFQILIPIQSASTRVLKSMDRDYTLDDLNYMFDILSKTNVELETHVIAGFPTETVSEWKSTVEFICKHRFRYVMGNIYMAGPGTKASQLNGQIAQQEKERRILAGSETMEKNGTVVGHSLNFRGQGHIILKKIDFIDW